MKYQDVLLKRSGFLKSASVVIPMVRLTGKYHMILTRRSRNLNYHPGQISFPGGIIEKGETPEEAAQRELFEEIGIRVGDIGDFQPLSENHTITTFIKVFPFVVILQRAFLNLNKHEVEDVFFVSYDYLRTLKPEKINIFGKETLRYRLPKLVIWGLTARIINTSLNVIDALICYKEMTQ